MAKKYIPSPMTLEEFSKPHKLGELFETRPCSRCGGCGHYSFNLMYGTVCFKCNGSGILFTPRGKRQLEAYKAARSKPASDVKVGEKIKPEGYKNFAYPEAVEPAPAETLRSNGVEVPCTKLVFSNVTLFVESSALVEVALPVEENYRNYVKALSA